jgi:hypothetical protein
MNTINNSSASFTATYSPEDNKLRLRISEWLGDEDYKIIKEMGFHYAPIQEHVYAAWTPQREDFCLGLAGFITVEEITLVERAEAKAERLDLLALKREDQGNYFQQAANRLSAQFSEAQPILIGHHSERKARRDQKRIESLADKAEQSFQAIDYWHYRATGVENHANRKANSGVRIRRIETLLKDMRDVQKVLNHGHVCLSLWEKIDDISEPELKTKYVSNYAGAQIKGGEACPWSFNRAFDAGELSEQELIDKVIDNCHKIINSQVRARWINHILNRLGYERSELGEVARFNGDVSQTILQAFLRTHGAHSPKVKKDGDQWKAVSTARFPLHLGDDKTISMSSDEWRDLMQSVGYEVPATKPKAAPILNFKADFLKVRMWGKIKTFKQIELKKAEHSGIYADYRGVVLSECGQFRVKVGKNPSDTEPSWKAEWVAFFISDSKVHDAPESISIIMDEVEAA